MSGPTASIVVLTHNRLSALQECLAAIATKTTCEYELIVIDNGSTDGTAEWLETEAPLRTNFACDLGYICLPRNEGVCARNHALRKAQGEFILQVDDDVLVAPGWDTSLLSWFDDPAVGAAGQEGFWLNWQGLMTPGRTLFLDRRRPGPGDYADLVMGYCWAWRNIGGTVPISEQPKLYRQEPFFLYDERFNPHWHEETDLQLQIKAAGFRIRCGPVVATHRSMKSWKAAHSNDEMVGLHHAVAHEHLLVEKWGARRAELGLELDRRGMQ